MTCNEKKKKLVCHYNTDFTFGFSSSWQQALLLQATSICLDATHCVTNIKNGILYTIVIRHPLTGTGCPVAFMFTENHSMYPIKEFLMFVRLSIGLQAIRKIIIDISATEYNAIQAVYPNSTIQGCLFHVTKAWISKIRILVKLGNIAQNLQAHKSIMTCLKSMMWEKKIGEFTRKLKPDFIANTNIIQLSVGRMGPEDRRRRSELNAEAINEKVLPLLIEQAEDSQKRNEVIYKVKSFTTDDIIYNIIVVEDKMKACDCSNFTWNNIACEHMYLLRRYNRNIAVFVISTDLPTPEVFTDNIRTEQQQQQTIEIELQDLR
ncbi:hypothetical protein MFLAVUS_011047 [Mucor flavus]|uniref:SWIM-type domain-containing protein n=1 Tax=Mucor flavus TaxID=439312 RepID=A0ABP9ZEH4_9FUNG